LNLIVGHLFQINLDGLKNGRSSSSILLSSPVNSFEY